MESTSNLGSYTTFISKHDDKRPVDQATLRRISGGSRIFQGGATPEFGPKTYHLTRFLQKTARK